MINEVRTLLGNRQPDPASLGYQYVSPEYTAFPFSDSVQRFLNLLELREGTDSTTINFLLAQYMSLVHQPDLKPLLSALDSRITYDPFSTFWFDQLMIYPLVTQSYGGSASSANVSLQVDVPALDTKFQPSVLKKYLLQYSSSSQVKVMYGRQSSLAAVTFDATGISNWLDLDEGFLRCRFNCPAGSLPSTFLFSVSGLNHTKLDLADIFRQVYYDHLPSIMGWARDRNMQTALGWVNGGFSTVDRFGAALIILAAQMKYEHNLI
jgi:hypothetical protein